MRIVLGLLVAALLAGCGNGERTEPVVGPIGTPTPKTAPAP